MLSELNRRHQTLSSSRLHLLSKHLPVAGVELIKQFSVCRLQAYENPNPRTKDPFHYLIGWGSPHTSTGALVQQDDRITADQANRLLLAQLSQASLPLLQALPGWTKLNENRQGALLSLAHSLNNDESVLSPRSLLGRALKSNRLYQIPTIISGYRGYNPPMHIAQRRTEEAALFSSEILNNQYTVINRSRLLELTAPWLQGPDICRLQKALIAKGYEIEADGYFGPLTQWAVEKFQDSVQLTVDGVAGVKTQRIIYARTLYLTTPCMMGSDIREIQSLLSRVGYNVNVSGVFSLRTWQAVVAFQKYFGLPEDGIVQGKTLAKLLYLPSPIGAVS